MSKSLGVLTLDLVAEVGRFNSGLDQASRNADKNAKVIQRNIQSIDDKISAVSSNIQKFAAVLGVGLSVNAFHGWIEGAMQAAANTATFASRIDVAVEDLTAMRFVAAQTGVSIDSFDGSMMRLTRRLGAAVNEGGPAITTLNRLGLSAEALLKLPLDERLKAIGGSMQKLDTQAERLTAAQDLAGDSARQLVPMFMMQAEEIDNARGMAEKLGYVYSTELAQSADALLTQVDNIKGAFNNLALGIAEDILPALERFINSVSADDIENALNGIQKGFDFVVTSSKALAIILIGRLAGSLTASSIAFIKARHEAYQYQLALAKMAGVSKGAAIGITAMGTAARGASIAMGLLGGPVGMAVLALSAIVAINLPSKEAATSIEELDSKLMGLNRTVSSMSKRQAERAIADLVPDIEKLKEERAELVKVLTESSLYQLQEAKRVMDSAIEKGFDERYLNKVKKDHADWAAIVRNQRAEIDDLTGAINKTAQTLDLVAARAEIAGNAVAEAAARGAKQFDKYSDSITERTALLGVTTELAKLQYDIDMGRYTDVEPARIQEMKDLALKYDLRQKEISQSKTGNNLADSYRRIMERTLSDEERRGLELSKNLDILRQYGASEADMFAVRRAAFESMSVSMPGMGEGGDTLTAQLARIHENMTQLDTWREEQLAKLELAYGNEESALAESLARREEIENDYRNRRSQFEGEMNQELLNLGINLSNDSLDALRQAGMESSGIYKAMFLANKASAFANAIISANEAGAKAMAAYPDPVMGMSVGAMVKGIGLANAGVIAATGLKGMAHSGLDKVPETGTWLLEKGERVVTSNTSAKLDATLESLRSQNAAGGGETVVSNVYITLSGEGDVSSRNEEGGSQLGKLMEAVTVKTMLKELKPGGILARR